MFLPYVLLIMRGCIARKRSVATQLRRYQFELAVIRFEGRVLADRVTFSSVVKNHW